MLVIFGPSNNHLQAKPEESMLKSYKCAN
jgi:hypothetical protein